MNRSTYLLTQSELAEIADHVGARWIVRGASQSLHDGSFAIEKVFFRSTTSEVTITAKLIETEVGGSIEELTALTIKHDEEEERLAQSRGLLWFQFRGDEIVSISIVRDTVRRYVADILDWELSADRGFIFTFTTGSLAICTGGDFSDDFFIKSAVSGEVLDIPAFHHLWESTLEERFETTRRILPIEELLETHP